MIKSCLLGHNEALRVPGEELQMLRRTYFKSPNFQLELAARYKMSCLELG